MKFGLLVYSDKYEFSNIGDYIQSLAARQFLPGVDATVCREALHEYSGEELKLILNGWFTHEPNNWPPSDAIRPLFVSFHINSVARDELTRERSIEYLKRWAPIGCRDRDTVRLLERFGVDAYFTGCLTLTLGMSRKRMASDGTIYFVDPHHEVRRDPASLAAYLLSLILHFRVVCRITANRFGRLSFKALLKSSAFYRSYRRLFSDEVLMNAVYVEQVIRNADVVDDAAKFAMADGLLRKYAAAQFVVTSRIHCALPCLGIGTPVLYVENQQQALTSACRLDGLMDLLHVVKSDRGKLRCDLTTERIGPQWTFVNKGHHMAMAQGLIRACRSFVEGGPSESLSKAR